MDGVCDVEVVVECERVVVNDGVKDVVGVFE